MRDVKNKAITAFLLVGFSFVPLCNAQDIAEKINLLKKEIISTESVEAIEPQLKELSDTYTRDNNFDRFYSFLENLEQDRDFRSSPLIYYYKTLTRFNQIQFLEKNKLWEQLFDNKDSYVSQIYSSLDRAKELSETVNNLSLRLKFLEWRLSQYREEEAIQILEDLYNSANEYSEAGGEPGVIKNIAEALFSEKETNYAKKLYSVYVSAISETDISKEELKGLAEGFLQEDRVDLAVTLYEAYLDKVINSTGEQDLVVEEMFAVAEKFVHSGWKEGLDPFYAEEVYQRIESLYGNKVFSDRQYTRAYNLERIKEHESCLSEYIKLVGILPKYPGEDNIYFRLGVINAYIFGRAGKAIEYLSKVVKDYPESQDYLNSLYHLGLLNQWQENPEEAMKYYANILEATKDHTIKPEIVNLTDSRVKEIMEKKDIDYNLRMFLGAVLDGEDEKKYIHLDLFAKKTKSYSGQPVKFQTNSYFIGTGCLQPEFTYLWSGQLGSNQNPFNEYEFETDYQDTGTKVVNVVLVGPTGVVDGTIEIADIYPENKD